MQVEPTMDHAGAYSATMSYLTAVKTVGSTDSDKVMAELKKMKINDMFAKEGMCARTASWCTRCTSCR